MRLIRHPVLCNYYLTYRCNASCGFCDIWEKPSPYVTEQQVSENLRDLKKMGVHVIDFTGGEPLLHRQLPDFLGKARQMGFRTTVTTNTLLYPKNAEKLKGLVSMLHFSLDSPLEEEHNRSRGVNCYAHVMDSIRIAKDLRERPDILFTVHQGNIHQIRQVYEEISAPNGLTLILNPIFSYNGVGGELDEASLQELEKWTGKRHIYLNKAFISFRRNGGNQTEDPVCKASSSTIVISPENKLVLPCYHLGLEELPLNGDLYELWHSPKVQQLVRMEGRHQACQGCTVNCYFMPSFHVQLNRYLLQSLPSTLRYAWEKAAAAQEIFS
jgi:MoaA/NifB/PqqE/SkfB family radical SAM enzyme